MEIKKRLIQELQRRLKVGNRRGVHLNAIPGKSRYKFDLEKLAFIDKNLPNNFIQAFLGEQPLRFKISLKENTSDLNLLFQEDKIQLVKISKSFENLINQTEIIEAEKGINTFGFGFPILVRRDRSDNKLTVAPILIWSLRIKKTREFNTWEIQRNEDDPIYINEVLINHLYSDSNIQIEEIPSEMLDDGLISKDELLDICSKLLKEINPSVISNRTELKKQLDNVVSIGDKDFYEKLTLDNNNATLDFGGLFSIFEVQKQNIINDYNNLLNSKDLTFNLKDFENHSFQPITSVETDPSQQGILNSLNLKRNILIQGPPGTGKSQTLTAILINALENHKKTIVVCEKRTALEVLHNALIAKGLNHHCILILDVAKDRKIAVDSVRERVDNNQYKDYLYTSKYTLDTIIEKTRLLIDAINLQHKKLDEKLLGNYSWTDIVGKLLSELNVTKENQNINLSSIKFTYDSIELNHILEIIQTGSAVYTDFKSFEQICFLNSEKFIGENPYLIEKKIKDSFYEYNQLLLQIHELESIYKTEYFHLRNAEIELQITEGNKIHDSILKIYEENKYDDNFLKEDTTNSVSFLIISLFSNAKRKTFQNQKKIKALFLNLERHYLQCYDLESFKFSQSLNINLNNLQETTNIINQIKSNFNTKLENEYNNLNLVDLKLQQYQTNALKSIQDKCTILKEKIEFDCWTTQKIHSKDFKVFTNSVLKLIDSQNDYFDNDNDIFSKEFAWFQFYNELNANDKRLLNELKYTDDWTSSFLIHYFNSLLISSYNVNLPTNDHNYPKLNSAFRGLKKEQLKYIKGYWYSTQLDQARDFELKNNGLTVGNLYLKKKGTKNPRLSLRQIVQKNPDLFTSFFPIILTSPDVASNLFKGKNDYFDIVMFDEASQLRLEDNFPSILKGKQVIIAGDEHQMPPSNYFSKVFDGGYDDEDEIDEEDEILIDRDDILLSSESLLDFGAELNFDKQHLDFHYRSKHPFLIDFSNYAFYNQRLKPLPTSFDYIPIKYIQVNGTFSDYVNDAEAEMVLSILENNIHRLPNKKYPTVGIATLNITQRNYIKSKIIERQQFPKFKQFNDKIQELEENGLFIKNLENIQGDERDVIILSTTYGIGKDGKFNKRYGPINHSKGYKLLNVIITRAKFKVYVCSSVPEPIFMNYKEDLLEVGANNKRAVFHAYLAYAKAVSEGNDELRLTILTELSKISTSNTSSSFSDIFKLDSPFQKEVYTRLVAHFDISKLQTNIKVSEFLVDIIYDPKIDGIPKIAIECDGSKNHSSQEAYLHDQHRQKILEDHGFIFHRIWSANWWRNPNKEISGLIEFISSVESKTDYKIIDKSQTSSAFTDNIQSFQNNTKTVESFETTPDVSQSFSNEKADHKPVATKDSIRLKSIVTVRYINNNKDITVQILETVSNTDIKGGIQKINLKSALAVSLIGHSKGDIIKVGNLDNYVEIIEIVNDPHS